MTSILKRLIPYKYRADDVLEGTETIEVQKSTWQEVAERNGRYTDLMEKNTQLRSKIDEADHIIKRQKDAIMIEQRKNKELMDSLCNDILPPVPIQLKGRTLIVIQGLPSEMTVEEANYISGILASYALQTEVGK